MEGCHRHYLLLSQKWFGVHGYRAEQDFIQFWTYLVAGIAKCHFLINNLKIIIVFSINAGCHTSCLMMAILPCKLVSYHLISSSLTIVIYGCYSESQGYPEFLKKTPGPKSSFSDYCLEMDYRNVSSRQLLDLALWTCENSRLCRGERWKRFEKEIWNLMVWYSGI